MSAEKGNRQTILQRILSPRFPYKPGKPSLMVFIFRPAVMGHKMASHPALPGVVKSMIFFSHFGLVPKAATKLSYCLCVIGSIEPCRTLGGRWNLSHDGC